MMFECTVSCPGLYTMSKYTDSLHFIAQVPAGGYSSYTLSFDPARNSSTTHYPDISSVSQTPSISNGHITLNFSPDSGLLTSVATSSGIDVAVAQNYWSYIDPQGGAYCLVEQQAAVQLSKVSAAVSRRSRASLALSQTQPLHIRMFFDCFIFVPRRSCSDAAHARHRCCWPRDVSNVANLGVGQRAAPALQTVLCLPCSRSVSLLGNVTV